MPLDTTTIRELSAVFREVSDLEEAYLVGGCVRDLLLGKVPQDVDIVVRGKPEKVAEAMIQKKGMTYFFLDRDREIVRVVGKEKKKTERAAIPQRHYDIAPIVGEGLVPSHVLRAGTRPMEGVSITLNLAQRDFTIDAMAIRIQDDDFTVIDPFGGKEDLEAGLVRALSLSSFGADPLRLLRAFRLAAALQFRIEDCTLEWIRQAAALVTTVAPERIRDEFSKILALKESYFYLDLLRKTGLLSHLVPDTDHAGMSLSKRVESVRCLEEILMDPGRMAPSHTKGLQSYAEETVAQGIPVKAILKWIVLDYAGKEIILHPTHLSNFHLGEAADRLRLALKTQRLIRKILMGWSWLRGLRHPVSVIDRKREYYRFYKAAGEGGVGAILIHQAVSEPDQKGGDGLPPAEMISWYFNEFVLFVRPLVSGEDLIRIFGMSPGPPIGDILQRVEEERGAGLLQTREHALQAIREWIAS